MYSHALSARKKSTPLASFALMVLDAMRTPTTARM